MPRTGLEAMGAVFILIPMAALHLVTTCKKEMPAIVEILVTAGADINARDKRGATPLIAAAGNTGDDAMTVILARGADPDATDRSGNTPLHLLASDSGKKDRVKGELRLIEAGANLELANKGRMTPLMLAVKSKKTEIVKALLSAGASPDTVDDRGTPLLHTVISCQPEKLAILDLLIEAGADVDIRNQSGGTAMHRALYGHLHVKCLDPAERLLRAGRRSTSTTAMAPPLCPA